MKLLITTQTIDKNDPILGFFHGWVKEFSKHFEEINVICLKEGEHNLPENVHVYSLGKEDYLRKRCDREVRNAGGISQVVASYFKKNSDNLNSFCKKERSDGKRSFLEEQIQKLKYTYRFYKYFWKLYVKKEVDFVFFHMGDILNIVAVPFFLIRKFKKTKFLWWKAYGHISVVGKLALLFCDDVVTSTYSGFPIKTSKRKIVGQAIDTKLFCLPSNNNVRNKEVLFVGRVTPIKYLETFIGVAKVLEKKGYSFTIVGPLDDKEYYEKLLSLSLGIKIQFVGSKTQNELVALYQNASIFLNTSLTNSMDKTVLESILCGCLPVTGNVAFTSMLSKHGLFVESATIEGYIEAILSLNEENMSQYRKELAENTQKHHSLDTFSERIFDSK